jgi:uncharacterized protein (TIGR03435 family)
MLPRRIAFVVLLTIAQTPAQAQREEAPRVSQDGRLAFEVVSITPVGRNELPAGIDEENPCSGAMPLTTGRTLDGRASTPYALIVLAYNPWKHAQRACELATTSDLIAGGPEWIKSARYAVRALFPEGADSASYERLLNTGEGTDAQRRLQAMLESRFNLTLRRETRQMPVYLLTVDQSVSAAQAKMAQSTKTGFAISEKLRALGSIVTSFLPGADGSRYVSISFTRQPVVRLAQRLATAAQRPVLDRTGLEGAFDFILEYDDSGVSRPTVFTALREQLGLKVEPSRAPVDVLVIEQIQRPSAN